MGISSMKTNDGFTVKVDKTARAYVSRDIVSNEISAYFIEMNGCEYEVSETVFDAVVKEFGLSYDDE